MTKYFIGEYQNPKWVNTPSSWLTQASIFYLLLHTKGWGKEKKKKVNRAKKKVKIHALLSRMCLFVSYPVSWFKMCFCSLFCSIKILQSYLFPQYFHQFYLKSHNKKCFFFALFLQIIACKPKNRGKKQCRLIIFFLCPVFTDYHVNAQKQGKEKNVGLIISFFAQFFHQFLTQIPY